MPFVPPEIRQQLNLVTSTPALEDVQKAATDRGLVFCPHAMTLTPANTFEGKSFAEVKATRAKRKAAIKAIESLDA